MIRPLLGVSRADIVAYADEHDLAYLEDSSNTDPKYHRNRIRHDLLPLLREEYNPQIDSALNTLADIARHENEFLDGLAKDAASKCLEGQEAIDRKIFGTFHRALQRRILVGLAIDLGALSDFQVIDRVVGFIVNGETGARCDFGRE